MKSSKAFSILHVSNGNVPVSSQNGQFPHNPKGLHICFQKFTASFASQQCFAKCLCNATAKGTWCYFQACSPQTSIFIQKPVKGGGNLKASCVLPVEGYYKEKSLLTTQRSKYLSIFLLALEDTQIPVA